MTLRLHSGLLTVDECREIIDLAIPFMTPVFRTSVADNRTGAKLHQDHPLLHRLRMFAMSQDEAPSLDYVEHVEVVSYTRGAFYPVHYDCPWRSRTLLVYLNDDYIGGETYFPHLNETIEPKTGCGVSWVNATGHRHVPEHSHGVRQLIEGEKWVAVVWTTFPKYNPNILSGTDPRRHT